MLLLFALAVLPVLYFSQCLHDASPPSKSFCFVPLNATSAAMSATFLSGLLLNNTIRRIGPSAYFQSKPFLDHMPQKLQSQQRRLYASTHSNGKFTYRLAAAASPKRAPPRQPQPGRDFWNYASTDETPAMTPYLRSTKRDSGEDAFFAATVGGNPHHVAFGVADGVGGWQDSGVDPSDFSHGLSGLMAGMVSTLEGLADGKEVKPQALLQKAYDAVLADPRILAGGCTASLAVADGEGEMETANLGDSGFLVLSPNKISARSNPQTHAFNTPYQLSKVPRKMQDQHAIFGGSTHFSETPRQADVEKHKLKHGDIVVFATDGVWDNLSAQDTLAIITRVMEENGVWFKSHNFQGAETMVNDTVLHSVAKSITKGAEEKYLPGLLASAVMREAKLAGLDRRRDGPFAKEVKVHYPHEVWHGGKPDDIAVVVCIAVDDGKKLDDKPAKAKL